MTNKIKALVEYLEERYEIEDFPSSEIEVYEDYPFDIFEYGNEQYYILTDSEEDEWVKGISESMIDEGKYFIEHHKDPSVRNLSDFINWEEYGSSYCESIESYFGDEIEFVDSNNYYNIFKLC